jgi:energy-converting hydrogenase Eha subunit E
MWIFYAAISLMTITTKDMKCGMKIAQNVVSKLKFTYMVTVQTSIIFINFTYMKALLK